MMKVKTTQQCNVIFVIQAASHYFRLKTSYDFLLTKFKLNVDLDTMQTLNSSKPQITCKVIQQKIYLISMQFSNYILDLFWLVLLFFQGLIKCISIINMFSSFYFLHCEKKRYLFFSSLCQYICFLSLIVSGVIVDTSNLHIF